MPLSKDPGPRENENYCSYCFRGGKFTYEGDLKGFQKIVREALIKKGTNPLVAGVFAWMTRFAPRWKNAKK